ncbi:hypothetical protein HHK36_005111 [Tetracentron sinense]|uniref:Uncharacterized protein n=1 Tax=Tetracentron sinense TaxID=13715 RepID=A0A835DQF6_TETSI|nr:hypothetical protein HHK36_005111 [Tetracentron sinense]
MAASSRAFLLLATALCFFSLLGFAHCHSNLFVEGKVYCDTCRVQFETKLSKYLPGAKVHLECRNRNDGNITYTAEGECDDKSAYSIPVAGEHEEDICEVVLGKSNNPDCAGILPGRDRARVYISSNNGISSLVRYANSLGFIKKEALPECPEILKELGILPSEVL